MEFAQPLWLLIGAILCMVLVLAYWADSRARKKALAKIASPGLLAALSQKVSPGKRLFKRLLVILAVFFLCAALARPQAGFEKRNVTQRGVDVVVALDTSRSMLAADVAPSRLARAKLAIEDFAAKAGGDRLALVPFAGSAHLLCPLTSDHNAFLQSLRALDTNAVGRGGTNIESAILTARAAMDQGANHRILVLVTDGENLEGAALDAAKEAAEAGVTIYAVGVGTPAGELVPTDQKNSAAAFAKDEEGNYVRSKLDEGMLQQIAGVTGGAYEPLGQTGQGLELIAQKQLSLVEKKDLAQREKRIPLERFYWPLGLAVLLLMLEFMISEHRTKTITLPQVFTAGRRTWARRAAIAGAAVVGMVVVAQLAHASPYSAQRAYEQGEFEEAKKQLEQAAEKNPEDAAIQYNLGAAGYRSQDYEAAGKGFQKALNTQDTGLQNQAYYNLGNTWYRQGELTVQEDVETTKEKWNQALSSYEKALALNQADEDARFNYDFVKKRLEELEQQQQQNQQCENPQNNEDNQENQDPQDKSQANNQNSQGGQDQKNQENQNRQGQPGQDKNNPQNKKDQGQSGQERADNQNQDKGKKDPSQAQAGSQDQKGPQAKPDQQPGQKGKDKQPARADKGNAGQKPEQKPGQNLQAQAGKKGGDMQAQSARFPGQMSPQQAKDLLNALAADEGRLMAPGQEGEGLGQNDSNWRNW